MAAEAGMAPVTPHLYLTQCLDDEKPEEREAGRKAGLELLKACDLLLLGAKYGVSEGMDAELKAADAAGLPIRNMAGCGDVAVPEKTDRVPAQDDKERLRKYARYHACDFCAGRNFHTCTSFDCAEPYKKAYEYAKTQCRKENALPP